MTRVFQPATSFAHRNAVVGWTRRAAWLYAHGYREAAGVVVDKALEGHFQDTLFYPICFLYRHALEVTLKELVRETEHLIRLDAACGGRAGGCERDAREVDQELEKTHSLQSLLDRLRERLKVVADDDLAANVINAVVEVHNLDPKGEVFRYARKQGAGDSFGQQQRFDLQQIRERLDEAIGYLADGVGGWLDAAQDYANDYLAEMEANMPSW